MHNVLFLDFGAENPEDGATNQNQRQQDPIFGEQVAASRPGVTTTAVIIIHQHMPQSIKLILSSMNNTKDQKY
jgi:hypothetical protein